MCKVLFSSFFQVVAEDPNFKANKNFKRDYLQHFSWGDFKRLVVIDIWVILGGMFLEFLARAKLRYNRPDLPRHFRVPGGKIGLWFCVISPIAIGLFAMFGSGKEYILPGSLAVASGPVAYWVCKRFVKEKS